MTIVKGEVHRCSVTGVFLRCISAMRFYKRFMKEIVAIMPVLSLSWLKLFVMGFIG